MFADEYNHNNLATTVQNIQARHGARHFMTFILYMSVEDLIAPAGKIQLSKYIIQITINMFALHIDEMGRNACKQAISHLQDKTDTTIVFFKLTSDDLIEKTCIFSLIAACKLNIISFKFMKYLKTIC